MKTVVLERVLATEKIVRQIEIDNVLVFAVDRAVTKKEIKEEVESLFDVKVEKVRTMTHKNKKITYVKLNPELSAGDLAIKLGIM